MYKTINDLSVRINDTLFHDPEFLKSMDFYIEYLRNHIGTKTIPIADHTVYMYEGDTFGLLASLGIPRDYHLIIMKVNDITHHLDINESDTTLVVPSLDVMNKLKQIYQQTLK